jgi:hypothetical protein
MEEKKDIREPYFEYDLALNRYVLKIPFEWGFPDAVAVCESCCAPMFERDLCVVCRESEREFTSDELAKLDPRERAWLVEYYGYVVRKGWEYAEDEDDERALREHAIERLKLLRDSAVDGVFEG